MSNEATAKSRDYSHLMGIQYKKMRVETEQRFPGIELWNREENRKERQEWIDEIWIPAIKNIKQDKDHGKLSERKAKAFAEAALSYFVNGIASWGGMIDDNSGLDSIKQPLEMCERVAGVQIAPEVKQTAIELFYPSLAANSEWIQKKTKEFSELNQKDPKAVDAFLLVALREIQEEIINNDGLRAGTAFERFRTVNTFFFTAYYPTLLTNRPTLDVLYGLIVAELARGNLSQVTADAYQDVAKTITARR